MYLHIPELTSGKNVFAIRDICLMEYIYEDKELVNVSFIVKPIHYSRLIQHITCLHMGKWA